MSATPKPVKRQKVRKALKRTRMKRGKIDQRMVEWSRQVCERDGWVCRRCGGPGSQAHHIAPRGRRRDLIYDLNNGMCVDSLCHQWIHEHPREAAEQGWLSTEAYERRNK